MTRQYRVQVTVSTPMRIALELLADRTGLTPSTQAMVLLRQALARTMESEACQVRVRQHNAQRNAGTWAADTTTERAVEQGLAAFGSATLEEVMHLA